jgi:hypothetical protein
MDSCCFIELALQSVGKHEASRENGFSKNFSMQHSMKR